MRDIKFRGKREFDCEWVFGDLLQYESGEAAIFSTKLSHYGCEATEIYKRDDVIPETIGQYTGLTDKNGKEIYEGDIVQHFETHPWLEPTYTSTMKWDDNKCAFRLDRGNGKQDMKPRKVGVCYEVIGNIYENPELLEV